MRNEELEARINREFQGVFSHGDAHRNKVLGLDSIRIDRNQIKGIEDAIDLLSRNLLGFLNKEFPGKGLNWCRIICDLKMEPIRERLEWARKPWQP
jgi:hypothetical protein